MPKDTRTNKQKAVDTMSQMNVPGKTTRPKKMLESAVSKDVSNTLDKRNSMDWNEAQVRGSGSSDKSDMSARLKEQAYKIKKGYDSIGASNPPNGPKKRYDK